MNIGILLLSLISVPTLHFFYTPDCGHCTDILLDVIPVFKDKYEFILKKYDINLTDNLRLLERMEEDHGTIGEDLPIVFMGDSVLYGPDETRTRLENIIKIYAHGALQPSNTTKKLPDSTTSDTFFITLPRNDIYLYYFTQPICRECSRTDILVDNIRKHYSHVKVKTYDLAVDSTKLFFEALAEYAGIPEDERIIAPTIIIDTDYLIREDITLMRLDSLFLHYEKGSPMLDTLNLSSAKKSIIERFSRFSILGIMLAGLLDGVNPCAFATLVFFVSYLLFIGKRRRDIALMAISFICAVFIAYLAIGIGAFSLLKFLTGMDIIAKILFFGFGLLAIVLGILSLRDFWLARKGCTDKMVLQLPLGIKQRIHKNIKKKTAVGSIIIGSFTAGFVVSFLEFGCTGQVYLPTITFMVSEEGFVLQPILALMLYNIMFIIPLAIIAILITLVSQKNISCFLESHIATVKFLTALLFFGLGLLLFLSV
jgi:cytochrome c biogenesis protein CcdA